MLKVCKSLTSLSIAVYRLQRLEPKEHVSTFFHGVVGLILKCVPVLTALVF